MISKQKVFDLIRELEYKLSYTDHKYKVMRLEAQIKILNDLFT
jgi:hypothetical protein